MIRVLFVTGSLAHNGTETFIMNVYRCINTYEFQVDFLLSDDVDSDYSKEAKARGSKLYYVPSRKRGPIKSYKALDAFFYEHAGEYQAVHYCCGSLTSIAPIVFAYKHHVPVRIIHSHSSGCTGFHNKLLHKLFKGFANKLATHHFACSDNAAFFFQSNGVSYQVIKNGIDVSRFDYNKDKRLLIRNQLGIKANQLVIGHVGRLNVVKNHKFILDVFAECIKQDVNAKLILVGDGELEREIKDKAKALNVIDSILFLGRRNDIGELMSAMDVFMMPSLFEGFPFVLVEAQAAALPCVISDVIDKKVDLTGNVHFLSLDNSPNVWAKLLLEVVSDYQRVSAKDKITKAGYDINDTTKMLEQVYSKKG